MTHDTMLTLGRRIDKGRPADATFAVPRSLATQTVAVLARKGAGKTYTMKRIVEALLGAGVQVVVLDAVGVWYGLRLAADGRKASRFAVPVLGGWRGDIDLAPTAGALVATTLVETGQSAVLDVSKFRKGDRKTFATDFAEELLHLKKDPARRSPLFLVLEEAQLLAPQKVQKGEERMLGAFEDLVKLGRNYGIGVGMISQRPQSINKDILNQTELLIVLQTNGPQERKTIVGWIVENDATGVDLVDELPRLQTGEAFVWSPGWLRLFAKVKIEKCQTFDASATPTGDAVQGAGTLKAIDLGALQSAMLAVIDERKANDPKALRARVAALEGEVAELEGALVARAAEADAAVEAAPALTAEEWQRLDVLVERFEAARQAVELYTARLAGDLSEGVEHLTAALSNVVPCVSSTVREAVDRVAFVETVQKLQALRPAGPEAPTRLAGGLRSMVEDFLDTLPPRQASPETKVEKAARVKPSSAAGGLKRGARLMLDALASTVSGSLQRATLSTWSAVKMGGTFSDYLSALRTRGFITEDGGYVTLTEAGRALAGTPRLSRADVLARHLPKLKAGARRMFYALDEATGVRRETVWVEKVALSERASIARGGTFSDYLSALRSRGLIAEEGSRVALSAAVLNLR